MEVAAAADGRIIRSARALVAGSGRAVSWLTLAMVLITTAIVVLRYGFNLGWIWLQESVIYLHALVFMVAAAWTLSADAHVRVDIIYRARGDRYRAWINLLGCILFLLPWSVFLLMVAWDYVFPSWQLLEGSREPGGLPVVYLLKTLILVAPALLLIQSLLLIRDSWSRLRSRGKAPGKKIRDDAGAT